MEVAAGRVEGRSGTGRGRGGGGRREETTGEEGRGGGYCCGRVERSINRSKAMHTYMGKLMRRKRRESFQWRRRKDDER